MLKLNFNYKTKTEITHINKHVVGRMRNL